MKGKKNTGFFWDEFIYGGHWFSISSSALAVSIMILLQVQLRWELPFIIYFLIQCLFNYNHYKELDMDHLSNSDRSAHLQQYKKILPYITGVYGMIFIILVLLFRNIHFLLFAFILLLLGLLFTKVFKKWTKRIVGFKTIYAAFTYCILMIIFIALYCSYPLNITLFLLFIIFGLRFMIGTGFSDIKDMKLDNRQNLLTFANYFGQQRFLITLHILNMVTFLLFLLIVLKINITYSIVVIFTYIYTFYYIQKTKFNDKNIQSITNIIVDGEYIFWPLLSLIGFFIF